MIVDGQIRRHGETNKMLTAFTVNSDASLYVAKWYFCLTILQERHRLYSAYGPP